MLERPAEGRYLHSFLGPTAEGKSHQNPQSERPLALVDGGPIRWSRGKALSQERGLGTQVPYCCHQFRNRSLRFGRRRAGGTPEPLPSIRGDGPIPGLAGRVGGAVRRPFADGQSLRPVSDRAVPRVARRVDGGPGARPESGSRGLADGGGAPVRRGCGPVGARILTIDAQSGSFDEELTRAQHGEAQAEGRPRHAATESRGPALRFRANPQGPSSPGSGARAGPRPSRRRPRGRG